MPLSQLSANAVVAEASLSKGAFFQHFPRKRDYVVELHRQFHDTLVLELHQSTRGMSPGAERLRLGIECYLDYCMIHAGSKAFLFDARADGDLGTVVAERNREFARVVGEDLCAMGWSQPMPTAHLAVAAIAEVAIIEHALGCRDPLQREALFALLEGGQRQSPPIR
jgi:TetR/AcrR family transcriptional repressor of nem operon